jgi:pimeloyl-ACP methyl ester carboxylesterase
MPLSLNLQRWGAGPPKVVLLHGLSDGAFVWNHIGPVLAARSAVAAIELRGHGDSPHDPQARYEPVAYAEDVLESMTSLANGSSVVLVGHSLGASVAIHVAAMARGQVQGLALVDGGPGMDPTAVRHIHQQFRAQPWFHESVDSFAAELQRRYPLARPRLLGSIAERALRPLTSGGYELKCDRNLLKHEYPDDDPALWEKLRAFDRPIVVIRGAASAVFSRRTATRIVGELSACRLHTVPLAGHTVMLDNPPEFLLAIERFLAEGKSL